jgi:hypothetical protein
LHSQLDEDRDLEQDSELELDERDFE